MLIRCVPAAAFGTNCWVLARGPGSDCVIVDPGFGVAEGVRDVLAADGLRPAAILLTHGHADHVWSVVPVCASADPPPAVYLHTADAYRLEDPVARVDPQLVAMLAAQFPHEGTWARPAGVVELSGGTDRVEAAGLPVDVRHTPGHTEGSVVFAMTADSSTLLVSGDVLFAGSVGRTDLPGGDQSAMVASLRAVMTSYADDTRVLPGHGATTTIGAERRGNPFVRSAMSVAAGAETVNPATLSASAASSHLPAASLSGFPEWSPAQRWVETRLVDRLRETFELHGFAPLQTRSVEPTTELLRKGESDKEIYLLSRLRDRGATDEDEGRSDDQLGLHFDLTVPFARYVRENAGRLTFPFKRYQIQQAWRGERPQDGRFREFVQADIDVVAAETLPDHYETDLPLVVIEALHRIDVGAVRMRASNRMLTEGFLNGLGIGDFAAAMAAIDKLAKVGPQGVRDILISRGVEPTQADACLRFAGLNGPGALDAAVELAAEYGTETPLFGGGLTRLAKLLEVTADVAPGVVEADLSITRGLDYYTGAVYETELVGHESLGSICSGGRYDDLATIGGVRHPGVGLSIGVTRLTSRLFRTGMTASRSTPTCVLVAVDTDETRSHSDAVARALRARGIPADTAPVAAKYGRQIRHADRSGIPFVWFCGTGLVGEVKDIRSGDQTPADAWTWAPGDDDRWPTRITG